MNQYANKNDIATVWAYLSTDQYGDNVYAAPTTQQVRWNDEQTKFVNAEGQELVSQAVIVLSTAVAVLDYIALGDFKTEPLPLRSLGAREVKGYSRYTNLRNSDNIMKAYI